MSLVPTKLEGKEFEELILEASSRYEKKGLMVMDRYGVEVSIFGGETIAVPSKPDFEGTRNDGKHFIIEAKVVSDSKFDIRPDKLKPRQVRHMLKRSRFGSRCFIFLHWNQRILTNSVQPAFTVAIPVNEEDPRWQKYLDDYNEAKKTKTKLLNQFSISRDESLKIGKIMVWELPGRCKIATPNLIPILYPELNHIILETLQPTLDL